NRASGAPDRRTREPFGVFSRVCALPSGSALVTRRNGGGSGRRRVLDQSHCQLRILSEGASLVGDSSQVLALSIFGAVTLGTYALLALFDPYWLRVRSRVGELKQGEAVGTANRGPIRQEADPGAELSMLWRLVDWFRGGDRARWQQRLVKAGIY